MFAECLNPHGIRGVTSFFFGSHHRDRITRRSGFRTLDFGVMIPKCLNCQLVDDAA